MVRPKESGSIHLPLDTELVDSWVVDTIFFVGHLNDYQIVEIAARDSRTRGNQQQFASVYNSDSGVLTFISTDGVRANQADALRLVADRYARILGAVAVPENVIHSGMNIQSITEHMLEPYPFDQLYDGDGYVSQADWDRMDEAPNVLTLDVTRHLRHMLTRS